MERNSRTRAPPFGGRRSRRSLRGPSSAAGRSPVVGVLVGDGGHGRLLFLGGRSGVGRDGGLRLLGAPLGDGGDVEGGQQVHRVHAGVCQLAQVAHAVGLVLREGHVGAAHVLGHGLVRGGEVAHVQLVDGTLGVIVDDGRLGVLPHGGRDRGVVHVDGHGARGVDGQAHRVGVGDLVRFDGSGGGHVDAHLPQVLGALVDGARRVVHAPAPVLAARGGVRTGSPAISLSAPRGVRVFHESRVTSFAVGAHRAKVGLPASFHPTPYEAWAALAA